MSQSGEPFDPYYQWLGIPPDEQPPNHYRLLGIQLFEDNREVIQNAADRQMVHLRTFQSGPRAALSQRLLNEVAGAKLGLLSPEKKATYDEQLRAAGVTPAGSSQSLTEPTPPLDPELGSLFRQTKRRAAKAKTAVARRTARRTGFPLLRGAVGLAMIAVAAVFAAIYFGRDRAPSDRLVLIWPEAERNGARLMIDGRVYDTTRDATVTRPGELEFALEAGQHSLSISRPGYQPLKRAFALESGTRVEITAAFTKTVTAANVFLLWPKSDRAGAILEIDGQPWDVNTPPLAGDASEVRFQLDPGAHKIRIERDGETVFDRSFTLDGKNRVSLSTVPTRPSTAQLALKWRESQRAGAKLEIDGKTYALQPDPADNSGERLLYTLRPGEHALLLTIGGASPLNQSVTLVAGERFELDVNQLLAKLPTRLTLVWPAADRETATVEIDGQARDLSTALPGSNGDEIAFEVTAGDHTLRIIRPGHEMFEKKLVNVLGDIRLAVAAVPLPRSRPMADELKALRKEFQSVYQEYDEFTKWNNELDPTQKRQLKRFLIARLASEAEKRPDNSPQQFIAFDESIRLAIESSEFVLSDGIVKNATGKKVYGEQEAKSLREKIWREALASPQFDSLVEYLKAQKAEGRVPSAEEQSKIVDHLKSLPQIETDFLSVEQSTTDMCDAGVLTDAAALSARVAVYGQAGKGSFSTPGDVLDLAARILAFIPTLFASSSQWSAQQAESLVDEVGSLRRKALTDVRATVEQRAQAGKLNDEAKRIRDLAAQFGRVVDARAEITAGSGTAAHHKLFGFWLLQTGEFEEALAHLREADDEELAQISQPLPATAKELSGLADEVERESKKSKYAKRQEEALQAYSQHLRRLALERDDGTIHPSAKEELQARLENSSSDDDERRFPKGKWVNLSDLMTVDELRERIKESAVGSWTVPDDGTVVAVNRTVSKLALPVDVQLDYGLRFVCRRTDGFDVNVNLPLGDSSVLLALGTSPRQASGLHLLGGKKVGEPGNLSTIKRADFGFQKDVPVSVEIRVEVLKAELQNAKQRKQTGGQDWATISVMINNRLLPPVSAPLAFFSVPPNFALARNVLGFSCRAQVAFGNIQLMRK